MKTFSLIFGIIFLANFSSAQYSYVYEIRHDNKTPKNEGFGDMSQYKYNTPKESSEANSGSESNTREFAAKGPEVGPILLNLIRSQMQEKNAERSESREGVWSSPENNNGKSSSLVLQSNTDSPTYARQPLPKSYINANELPNYVDKYRSSKGYPTQESRPLREEPNLYEQRPIYTTSYPSHSMESRPPTRSPRPQPQEKEEKLRTVHSIQTPNYRIQLVSKPESLEKLMPFLEQYQLSQKPFQSYSQSNPISSRSPTSSEDSSSYRESAKPLMLSVEPDARIIEPTRGHTREPMREPMREPFREPKREPLREPLREPMREPMRELKREMTRQSEIPESLLSLGPLYSSRYEEKEREQMRSQPIRQYPVELKSEPRPILEMPRQQLPPQMQQLKGRPITQLPPPEPRSNPLIDSRPSYSMQPKLESLPVTALFQMSAPNLLKGGPQYSRVEYAAEEEPKREGREPTVTYREEPVVYRMAEKPRQSKEEFLVDLRQQLEKLQEDPSAQKSFFDKIKSQSMEMSDRSRTKYREDNDDKPLISSDPNYKPSPIPDEYKPFTQTRYYKTYV